MLVWSEAEQEILRAITLQVRLLTLEQVARGWFSGDTHVAADCMKRLEAATLITCRTLEVAELEPRTRPLFSWRPNRPTPKRALKRVSSSALKRWRGDFISCQSFIAAPRAVRAFGAFSDLRRIRSCEVTHDFHLSEVFIHYRISRPRQAKLWLGEAAFPKLGRMLSRMKDPDAFLIGDEGKIEKVIEVAGRYTVEHLTDFHNHCAERAAARLSKGRTNCFSNMYDAKGTRYEIW